MYGLFPYASGRRQYRRIREGQKELVVEVILCIDDPCLLLLSKKMVWGMICGSNSRLKVLQRDVISSQEVDPEDTGRRGQPV
jgi:hypothetical protein